MSPLRKEMILLFGCWADHLPEDESKPELTIVIEVDKKADLASIDTTMSEVMTGTQEIAVFAAGCFWGVEETFRSTKGVKSTRVGYVGGHTENPTYKDVCTGRTDHAEAVEVTFDPSEVTFDQLLNVFWDNHNPTQLNYQGPDSGTQYRTAIFYQSDSQRVQAEASKAALGASGKYKRPIVTQIVPAAKFYPAEDYHQQYLAKRGLSSCHI
jgi:peptide-methionine (S)-S-oxide reductase